MGKFICLTLMILSTGICGVRIQERGINLDVSNSFFREAGRASRDLAVLAALDHKERTGRLRVLDACAGSGSRA